MPEAAVVNCCCEGESMHSTKYPDAYCVRCQTHTPTVGKRTVVLENHSRSRAVTGSCSQCGTDVYKILPKQKVVSLHPYRTTALTKSGLPPLSTGMIVRQKAVPTTNWLQLSLLTTLTCAAAFSLGMLLSMIVK